LLASQAASFHLAGTVVLGGAIDREADYGGHVIAHLNRGTAKPGDLLPDVWKQSHPEPIRQYRVEERRDKAELARLRRAPRRVEI
jgi:hypothetical protein